MSLRADHVLHRGNDFLREAPMRDENDSNHDKTKSQRGAR
jgi:hypothetical protein